MDEETKTQKGQETSATQGHIARKQQNCDLKPDVPNCSALLYCLVGRARRCFSPTHSFTDAFILLANVY